MEKPNRINLGPLVMSGVVILVFLVFQLWISDDQASPTNDIFTLMPACLISLYLVHKACATTRWGMRSWICWLCFGCFCASYIVVESYRLNYRTFFVIGLGAEALFISLALRTLSLHPVIFQFLLTILLGIILLPLADFMIRPSRSMSRQSPLQKAYAYSKIGSDPVKFKRWWDHYLEEWFKAMEAVQMPDPKKILAFRLKPGSRSMLFDSEIRINSLGFRDEEFPQKKQGEYRIVVLGESTTMGCTLRADDVPWPKVLERMIQGRLKPPLPVRVINAGVAAYTLEDNLKRFDDDILPLEPDLIISYHGYNGFPFINQSLPAVAAPPPPQFMDRPLYLLAKAEYRLKHLRYLQKYHSGSRWSDTAPTKDEVMNSGFRMQYETLITAARKHKIPLVLANFNMAVNLTSKDDVIDFYRGGFPHVHSYIRANIAHSQILDWIAQHYPDIRCVNAQKNLDGHYEKFIDLVHFTQSGRQQLAENIFEQTQDLFLRMWGTGLKSRTNGDRRNE
jgi:lysophospholipase L1-like esterase